MCYAGEDSGDMTRTSAPGTVVVGYDGSHHADQALTWAAELASLEKRILTIVHVIKPVTALELGSLAYANMIPTEVRDAVREAGRTLMFEARARIKKANPDLEVATVLGEGDPRKILLGLSENAECLVLGSRGRGRLSSLLLGSVSVAVSRFAECPVVVVRPYNRGTVRNGVLVGTDGTERTATTVEFAYRQASMRNLPLTVLYCVPFVNDSKLPNGILDDDLPGLEEHRLLLAESVAGMEEKFPDVRARLRIGQGIADKCLIEASPTMDLVVVGHHASGAPGDLVGLGSFAPVVVEGSACPVAVVCSTGEAQDA